jgi:hypothetical protein
MQTMKSVITAFFVILAFHSMPLQEIHCLDRRS